MIKTLIIRNISTIIGGIVGKNRFCIDELPSMLNLSIVSYKHQLLKCVIVYEKKLS